MFKYFVFVLAFILQLSAGSAFADRGFWYHKSSDGWKTEFWLQNTNATTAYTATVTFDYGNHGGTATLLGSTSRVLQPAAIWNFNTGQGIDVSSLTSAQFQANTRGAVKITGSDGAGAIKGQIVQRRDISTIYGNHSTGFVFRIGADLAGE